MKRQRSAHRDSDYADVSHTAVGFGLSLKRVSASKDNRQPVESRVYLLQAAGAGRHRQSTPNTVAGMPQPQGRSDNCDNITNTEWNSMTTHLGIVRKRKI